MTNKELSQLHELLAQFITQHGEELTGKKYPDFKEVDLEQIINYITGKIVGSCFYNSYLEYSIGELKGLLENPQEIETGEEIPSEQVIDEHLNRIKKAIKSLN